MKAHFLRALLGVSGLLLLVIGTAVLVNPVEFAAANGVQLPNIPSVLSEYRAPGGMLFVCALLILLSAFRARYVRTGLALATLVYGSYGISRLIGVVADGVPSAALTQAMAIELLLGSVCLIAWLTVSRREHHMGLR